MMESWYCNKCDRDFFAEPEGLCLHIQEILSRKQIPENQGHVAENTASNSS